MRYVEAEAIDEHEDFAVGKWCDGCWDVRAGVGLWSDSCLEGGRGRVQPRAVDGVQDDRQGVDVGLTIDLVERTEHRAIDLPPSLGVPVGNLLDRRRGHR